MISYDLFIAPVITLSSKDYFEGYMSSQGHDLAQGHGANKRQSRGKADPQGVHSAQGPSSPQHVSSSRRSCSLKAGNDEAWRASDKLICIC